MDEKHHTTEWALLFPLKAGLFTMKSSTMTRSAERIKKKTSCKEMPTSSSSSCNNNNNRLGMRRGSSMSDLDKMSNRTTLPDLVRSTTANQHFSTSPVSLPHSPCLSRSFLSSNTTISVRGSIGDLMNQKKYGSSQWSVRSETLIAKTVPLSTVTPRHSPPPVETSSNCITIQVNDEQNNVEDDDDDDGPCGPLTAAQRTQRLSKLIKQQRISLQRKSQMVRIYKYFHSC